MSIIKALALHLRNNPAVANLVGSAIFRGRRPTGTPARAITLTRLSAGLEYNLLGQEPDEDPVIAIDIWASSEGVDFADDLVAAVVDAISGWPGGLWADVYVSACTIEDHRDFPIPDLVGDSWTFRERLTVRVNYTVGTPVF